MGAVQQVSLGTDTLPGSLMLAQEEDEKEEESRCGHAVSFECFNALLAGCYIAL